MVLLKVIIVEWTSSNFTSSITLYHSSTSQKSKVIFFLHTYSYHLESIFIFIKFNVGATWRLHVIISPSLYRYKVIVLPCPTSQFNSVLSFAREIVSLSLRRVHSLPPGLHFTHRCDAHFPLLSTSLHFPSLFISHPHLTSPLDSLFLLWSGLLWLISSSWLLSRPAGDSGSCSDNPTSAAQRKGYSAAFLP